MSRRSLGTLVAPVFTAIVALPLLAIVAVDARRVEGIPDFVLALTRGSSTNFNGDPNVTCSENEAANPPPGGGYSIAWDKCTFGDAPAVGPPTPCVFCLDRTTQGTRTLDVPPNTGTYTPSKAAPTVCGNKRTGFCGQSPADPTVYTCQFDTAAGQCGGLPQNGLYQSAQPPLSGP